MMVVVKAHDEPLGARGILRANFAIARASSIRLNCDTERCLNR